MTATSPALPDTRPAVDRVGLGRPPRVRTAAVVETLTDLFVDDADVEHEIELPVVSVQFTDGGTDSFIANRGLDVTAETLQLQTGWTWDDPVAVSALRAEFEALSPRPEPPITWPVYGDEGQLIFKVNRLMDDVEAHLGTHFRMGFDNRLWWYQYGVYLPTGEEAARTMAFGLLSREEAYQPARVKAVVQGFLDRSASTPLSEKPNEHWVNLRNGMLDWGSGELLPHHQDRASTVQLPVRWRPDAECPAFERFVAEAVPEIPLDYVYELTGYLLYADNPEQLAVLLRGPGASGKSTLLRVWWALLGGRNCTALTLHDLSENRFATANLYGKLANICGDLDSRSIRQTGPFKKLTGGDPIQAEHKNKPSFTFTAFAKPIFSANVPPPSADESDGYTRRWVVLRFGRGRARIDQDPRLTGRLTTTAELEGLLRHSVEGLRRLMARGSFVLPDAVEASTREFVGEVATTRRFIEEELLVDPEGVVPIREVKERYRAWCEGEDVSPVSKLNRTIEEVTGATRPTSVVRILGIPTKVWRGIRLTPERPQA